MFTFTVYQVQLDIIFVKAVDKESEEFGHLRQTLPAVSEAKKKEGIFVGSQIAQLFEDHDFSTKLNSTERRAWKAFENICRNFLGNAKAENYREYVQELISSHSALGCIMTLKLYFLYSHLDFFPLKTRQPSPTNMTSFHQDSS